MSTPLVQRWLDAGELDLPLPGSGQTAKRWRKLAAFAEIDVVAGRLAEAHADATAILAELGGHPPQRGELWAVWAAESAEVTLTVDEVDGVPELNGTKSWCSGAGLCTHALVTAHRPDGDRGLYAVDLRCPQVTPLEESWRNAGMKGADTRTTEFRGAAAIPVGGPGEYLQRAGFWYGAIGVAACWLGAARGVAAALYRAVSNEHDNAAHDTHAQAHLGAVDAALTAADAVLIATACQVDAGTDCARAELIARRARAVVETAVEETIVRTGRALGPAPLVLDGEHARRVADLTIYIRQSHAERDLAALGRLAAR
jgi:alkylation response protein AidB-like acyl-CoA dehydrogenase